MPIKLLDRLLFTQGGRCFFCNVNLPRADASIEHLVAQVNGGSDADDNCVACCKAINALLGRMSIKDKIRVVLNQKGKFACPNVNKAAVAAAPTVAPKPKPAVLVSVPAVKRDNYSLVLADLKRRSQARPSKVKSLKNSIRSTLGGPKCSLTEPEFDELLKRLLAEGKIKISGTDVSYAL